MDRLLPLFFFFSSSSNSHLKDQNPTCPAAQTKSKRLLLDPEEIARSKKQTSVSSIHLVVKDLCCLFLQSLQILHESSKCNQIDPVDISNLINHRRNTNSRERSLQHFQTTQLLLNSTWNSVNTFEKSTFGNPKTRHRLIQRLRKNCFFRQPSSSRSLLESWQSSQSGSSFCLLLQSCSNSIKNWIRLATQKNPISRSKCSSNPNLMTSPIIPNPHFLGNLS